MYWSRKFKLFDCNSSKDCNYIGVARNDPRHSIRYPLTNCGNCDKVREHPRILNDKENNDALSKKGAFNDIYKNRFSVDKAAGIRCNRSLMHLYRRNQPAKRGELGNDDNYNYSYNEFLRIKKMSYLHNLPTKKPPKNSITNKTGGYGGMSCEINECNTVNHSVIWKPNNEKYNVQGAVPSSSRLDRLKLDTIRGSKKCDNNDKCNGMYFAGKPRYYGKGKEYVYNDTHKESCNVQDKAKGRVRGFSKQMSGNNCY